MNPLKNLFNKVFDQTPPAGPADPSKEDAAFEWNPDQETVAPTSARATSWKRGDTSDEAPLRVPGEPTDADIAAAAHSLPTPTFEKISTQAPSPDATLVSPPSSAPVVFAPVIGRTLFAGSASAPSRGGRAVLLG